MYEYFTHEGDVIIVNLNNSRENKNSVWRRLLSVVLAACMVISMTPTVIAEDSPAATAEGSPAANTEGTPIVTTSPEVVASAEPVTQAAETAETAPTEPAPEVTTPAETEPAVTDPTDPVLEEPVPDSEQVQLIRQLISALPFEVTEENSEEVRMRLQEISDLYSQLSAAEQEEVDITPCFLLQAQLGELDSAAMLTGGATETEATLVTGSDDTWEGGFYKVSGEITNSKRVTVRGNVTLILEAGSKLTIKSIGIYNGGSPTIKGSGELVADCTTTNESFAGIEVNENCTLVIESGTVYARGGASFGGSAGIGSSYNNSCGSIIIKGGNVTATGCTGNSAGIGGGKYNTGGTVIATGLNGIGDGKSGSGCTFSTGVNGNAVITANSITDKYSQSAWSGIIYDNANGGVYGNQTLIQDLTAESGKTLTINEGSSLTVPAGMTLTVDGSITNNGTIINNGGNIAVKYGGDISGTGSITGEGSFTTESLTEEMVIAPTDIAGGSADRSDDVKAGMRYQPVTICGREFTPNLSAWTVSAAKVDDLTYTVNYTHANGTTFSKTVSILPAELTVAAVEIADKAYDGNTDAAVAGVTFTDPNSAEVIVADYTAAAVFDTSDAGTGKTVTVTIALAGDSNYTLTSGEFTTTGNITPRTLTESDITVTLDNYTHTWAGK